jgi:hypothetical protein
MIFYMSGTDDIIQFKALIVDDFYNAFLNRQADEENTDFATVEKAYSEGLQELANRIQGKEVVIEKHWYPFGEPDYFEQVDNNFVLYEELFTAVSDRTASSS